MRIAMISYYLPSGSKIGVGYQAHLLANSLTDAGHQVTMFSGCSPSDGALYETRQVALHGTNRIFKFAWYLRQVDWTPFDVVHAHGDDYLLRNIAPVHIRTMHGSCLAEAIRIKGAKERLRMTVLGLSELVAVRVADHTVAVSHHTTRWVPGIDTVIPNAVDVAIGPSRLRSPHPTILFVGTYGRRKRGWLVAEAFQRYVRPKLPDAELWMVCEDAPPLDAGISILGRVSADHLAELYSEAWVFCLPSSYEGFGIPYIEAMAGGCAVVSTPNPGAIEVTLDGRYGRICTPDRIGVEILELLLDGEARDSLAQRSLQHVQQYSTAKVVSAYEQVYASTQAR